MYVIEDDKGGFRMWGAAIDEGYGRYPYIELNLMAGKKGLSRKKITLEQAPAVARLLRGMADEMDAVLKIIESRRRDTRGEG